MRPSFLILSAGESKRIGFPKALLSINEETLIQLQVERVRKAGYNKIIIVIGYHKEKVLPELKKLLVQIAINYHPENGMFSSIQTGLKSINHSPLTNHQFTNPPVFIQPIDCIVPCSETLHKLGKSLNQVEAVVPTYKNKSGHPLLISSNVQREIIESNPDYRLDRLLKEKFFNKVKMIEVDDLLVISNINCWQDWEEWKRKIKENSKD